MKRFLLSSIMTFGILVLLFTCGNRSAQAQTQAGGCVLYDDDYFSCLVEVDVEIAGAGSEIDGEVDVYNDDYFEEEVYDVTAYGEIDDQNGNYVGQYGYDPFEPFEADAYPYATGVRNGYLYFVYAEADATLCYDDGGEDGDDDCEDTNLYAGTAVYIDNSQPVIYEMTPNHDVLGASMSTEVSGDALVDSQSGETNVRSSDSNVGFQVTGSPSSTNVTLSYQIGNMATLGADHVTFSTSFGAGDPYNFFVCPAVPNIAGISQPSIDAGGAVTLTINGSGFGATPTASIAGAHVNSGATSNPSDTSIQLAVSVDVNAPNETATITVTGAQSGDPDHCAATSVTYPITINAVTPAPQIMFYGQNVSGTTQTVYAGQQIALSVTAPAGYTANQQSWMLSAPGRAIGGYGDSALDGGPPSAAAGGKVAALPAANTETYTFYWTGSGDQNDQVTYTYTLDNGQQNSATVTFIVNGPQGVVINSTEGSANISTFQRADGSRFNAVTLSGVQACVGTAKPLSGGVSFLADESQAVAPPAGAGASWGAVGTFSYVQLLSDSYSRLLQQNGYETCRTYVDMGQPVLDNTYPYAAGNFSRFAECQTHNPHDTAVDAPARSISIGDPLGAVKRSFSATMYLLWTPPAAAGCNGGAACVVPVTIGNTPWNFCSGAVNNLTPGATIDNNSHSGWTLTCGSPAQGSPLSHPGFQGDPTYPTWINAATNNNANCVPN